MELETRHGSTFTDQERHLMIQEYLAGGISKLDIWRKYTGQTKERGHLLRWMRKLGYEDIPEIDRNLESMPKKSTLKQFESATESHLRKENEALKKALEYAKLKALAYSTMIDVAEDELKISIRKK